MPRALPAGPAPVVPTLMVLARTVLVSTVPRGRCEHPERAAREPGAVGHTGTVRVLVVEDERRLASAVRRGLTAEGFVVDLAHDGVDGLHLAREGEYDAVVLDLMLPGLSGYQVCERLRAGDLSLDPAARVVRRGSAVVALTAREFSLLEYLLRRAGQVVSKAELLSHVWDAADEIADLNVVEVYVGYVRRKIDAPFGRHAVCTVRGAGYLLAADGG